MMARSPRSLFSPSVLTKSHETMRPVPARHASDGQSEFFRLRHGAAQRHSQRERAGDKGGRQFDRQQDQPIGRDIEQAAERVREGLAEHGVRFDNDRAAAARARSAAS